MKNSLTADLQNILSCLKQQNTDINKTLRQMKKSKSMHLIKTDKNNPELKIQPMINEKIQKVDKEKAVLKKSKSFHRCKSCQIIDNKDDCKSGKQSQSVNERYEVGKKTVGEKEQPVKKKKQTVRNLKQQLAKGREQLVRQSKKSLIRMQSPRRNMTKEYFKLLNARKIINNGRI